METKIISTPAAQLTVLHFSSIFLVLFLISKLDRICRSLRQVWKIALIADLQAFVKYTHLHFVPS